MAIETLYPAIRPSLDLNFAGSKTLDPRITFSRASAATYYDGKTVAKAEENLLVNSQSFGISTWVLAFASIVGNSISAPDGTLTATKLLADNSQNYHAIRQGNSLPAGNVYTMSVYAKAAEFSRLYFSDLANGRVAASFDLVALSSTNPANSPGYLSSSVSDVGGGWRRCVVTFSAGSSTISLAFAGYPDTGATLGLYGANYIGDGTSGIYIWGAQLEQRSQVTAYTPTTSQPITNYIPVLQTAPAGVPRFDHNPVTGESLGLLVEEQQTNLLTYSEQFDNAFWLKTNALIGQNFVLAPDGTLTGDKLIENSVNGQHAVSGNVNAVAGTYTLSVYLKAAERTWAAVGIYDVGAGTSYRTFFNLYSGAVGTNAAGNTATITPVGNGWFRCSVSRAITGSGTNSCSIFVSNADGVLSYQGDGYSGIYIWGAQLEAGAFPTSYIKTEASQVTRAADSASMMGANFSSWYRQDEGSFFVESAAIGYSATDRYLFLASEAGSINPNSISSRTFNGAGISAIVAGSTNQASFSFGSIPAGQTSKVALAYKNDSSNNAVNGTLSTPDNSSTIPFPTRFDILGNACRTYKRIVYYTKRSVDTQLQTLTTS